MLIQIEIYRTLKKLGKPKRRIADGHWWSCDRDKEGMKLSPHQKSECSFDNGETWVPVLCDDWIMVPDDVKV